MENNKKTKKPMAYKKAMQNKNFRYGGYAAAVTFILIGILIVVNLVVSSMNITMDLTPNQMFSISDETKTILADNNQAITIYSLYETGNEEEAIANVLKDYEKVSSNILVNNIDPVLNPGFTENYKANPDDAIVTGSLIVVNEENGRHKIVAPNELFSVNYYSGAQTLSAEQAITAAIDYVTNEKLPKLYMVEGHNEKPLSFTLQNKLTSQNYQVENVNLLVDDIEALEQNVLIINSPTLDLSPEEAEKLTAYLEAGGRSMIFTDFDMPNLANFETLLKRYGLQLNRGIIIEGDKSHIMGNYANIVLPELNAHEITDKVKEDKLYVVTPHAPALMELEQKKRETEITPLLTTTKQSFLKGNMVSQSIEKEAGDIDGPFNVAVTVKEDNYNDIENTTLTTKLVVYSSSLVMDDSFLAATGNMDLLVNSFNWLSDQKNNISIRGKDLMPEQLMVDQTKALLYAGGFIILLPLIVMVSGIVVWLRRRHL